MRRLESHTASRPTWLLASALSDKRIPQRPGSLIKGLNTHSRPRSQKREAAPGSRESSRGRAEPTGQKQRACAAEGRPPPSLPVPRLREGPRQLQAGPARAKAVARHSKAPAWTTTQAPSGLLCGGEGGPATTDVASSAGQSTGRVRIIWV